MFYKLFGAVGKAIRQSKSSVGLKTIQKSAFVSGQRPSNELSSSLSINLLSKTSPMFKRQRGKYTGLQNQAPPQILNNGRPVAASKPPTPQHEESQNSTVEDKSFIFKIPKWLTYLLGSGAFVGIGYLTNLYFQMKEKEAREKEQQAREREREDQEKSKTASSPAPIVARLKETFDFSENFAAGPLKNEELEKLFDQMSKVPNKLFSFQGSSGCGKSLYFKSLLKGRKGVIHLPLRKAQNAESYVKAFMEALNFGDPNGKYTPSDVNAAFESAVKSYYEETKEPVFIVVDDLHSTLKYTSLLADVGSFCASLLEFTSNQQQKVRVVFVSSDEKGPKYLEEESGYSRLMKFMYPKPTDESLRSQLEANVKLIENPNDGRKISSVNIKKIVDTFGSRNLDIETIFFGLQNSKKATDQSEETNLVNSLMKLQLDDAGAKIEAALKALPLEDKPIGREILKLLPNTDTPISWDFEIVPKLSKLPVSQKKTPTELTAVLQVLVKKNVVSIESTGTEEEKNKKGQDKIQWSYRALAKAF